MLKSKRHRNRALKDLGTAIRNRRIDLGISQQELGVKADLHRTHITDIEGGSRNVAYLTLLRLAHGLDCSMSELIENAEGRNGKQ